jgi:hypothetical protein
VDNSDRLEIRARAAPAVEEEAWALALNVLTATRTVGTALGELIAQLRMRGLLDEDTERAFWARLGRETRPEAPIVATVVDHIRAASNIRPPASPSQLH